MTEQIAIMVDEKQPQLGQFWIISRTEDAYRE